MWWAERSRPPMLLVLRAGALDAAWAPRATAHAADWQTVQLPLATAPPVVDPTAPPAADEPSPTGLRAVVSSAFASLRVLLLQPPPGAAVAPGQGLIVLLSGPGVGVVELPWSDALLQADSAHQHVRVELLARGFDVQPEDLLTIDRRPPLGRPRTVFWVPDWLAREVSGLASALGARLLSVQALNIVAANWAARHGPPRRPGQVTGVLGSGALQLLAAGGGGLGETLADTMAGAALEVRAAGLWQRARIRFPSLAAATGLQVLSLDETPPPRSGSATPVDWLRWPADGRSRTALDRSLLQEAQARPVVQALPPASRPAGMLWAAASLLGLAVAMAFAIVAWQRQSRLHELTAQTAPASTPARSSPPTQPELAELRAVNTAVQQINLPFPSLLRTLQPPRDIPVLLLGLDLAARGGETSAADSPARRRTIKLSAESPSGLDMTRYVVFLGSRPGMSAAQLVRHELNAAEPAGRYRFDVELIWQH